MELHQPSGATISKKLTILHENMETKLPSKCEGPTLPLCGRGGRGRQHGRVGDMIFFFFGKFHPSRLDRDEANEITWPWYDPA